MGGIISYRSNEIIYFINMPPFNKPNYKGKALVAGASAGIFEICCTYPTEFVKTSIVSLIWIEMYSNKSFRIATFND